MLSGRVPKHLRTPPRLFVIEGLVMFLLGLGGAGYGAKQALTRSRPWSYVGMLVAPAGALLALAGLGRLVNAKFFGG